MGESQFGQRPSSGRIQKKKTVAITARRMKSPTNTTANTTPSLTDRLVRGASQRRLSTSDQGSTYATLPSILSMTTSVPSSIG